MSASPTVVASDAHLGAVPPASEERFLDFLDAVSRTADDLVLAGDVFDFWFEYRSAVLREHFPALRALADVVDAGTRVRWIGGNHDAWAGSFLRDQVGLELLDAPLVTDVGGRKAFLAHGDGLAGGDWGYRILKAVLRSRPAGALFRLLHPDLGAALARRASHTSTEARGDGPAGRKKDRAEALSRHAARLLEDDPSLDLVVLGHAHRPELTEVEPGRHYLNPGDWIHSFTYGVVGPDGVELRRWDDG